jgi:hypothetical protein
MAIEFWKWLTVAALVWYTVITIYVSVRGVFDIKNMLARLRALETLENDEPN